MPDLPKNLSRKFEKRVAENALREMPLQDSLVDFSSNDYLGFSREKWISDRTKEILNQNDLSNSATGSRLLTGNHILYKKLEEQLCNFHNSEAALVFNSGYDANLGFFSAIPQRGDYVFYDELIHASIRDGIKLGNAKAYKFKHNDISDLKSKLILLRSKTPEITIYIVTESVFSMDGDSPDLNVLVDLCANNNYYLVVDEAHAMGVFGNGLCQELKVESKIFARVVTFGKALGCHGAAILGSKALKQYLVNFARSLIYTTALPPHTIASVIAGYEFLVSKNGRAYQNNLLENIAYFKRLIVEQGIENNFIESNSAIQSIWIPGNKEVKTISKLFNEEGFNVKAILSPTVQVGKERLRFCLHAFNTKATIKKIVQRLKKYIDG